MNVADPTTADQLMTGFYGVEMHAWRWTGRQFSVMLGPPTGAAKDGAKLILRLYLPGSQIHKLGPVTLEADVAGWPLGSETFSKEGSFSFIRDVPSAMLDTNVVPVDFSWDKASGKSLGEGRELGAVVTSIELQTNRSPRQHLN